jgi:hypothetical protein
MDQLMTFLINWASSFYKTEQKLPCLKSIEFLKTDFLNSIDLS